MKKLLALVLALVMTLGLATVGSNAAFKDADKIQYTEAVDVMSAIGVLAGMDDGSFNPTGTLTREQGAKIISYMLMGGKENGDSLTASKAPFSDVAADRWSAGAIAYCANAGILAGVGDGKFDPTGSLTGYAFSKMLLTALGYSAEREGLVGGDWQLNAAKLINKIDLANGLGAVNFNAPLTRDAAAKLSYNTLTEDMVEYNGGMNIVAGDVRVSQDVTATTVANAAYSYGSNGVGAPVDTTGMQFVENYFSNLKVRQTTDEYGVTTNYWYLGDSRTDYTYDPTAKKDAAKSVTSDIAGDGVLATYTTNVGDITDGDLYKLLGATTNGTLTKVENSNTTGTIAYNKGGTEKVLKNYKGATVEIVDSNNNSTHADAQVIVKYPYLAKVTAVTAATSSKDRYVTLDIYNSNNGGATRKVGSVKYETEDFAKNDWLLVYVDATIAASAAMTSASAIETAGIIEAVKVEKVTGKITVVGGAQTAVTALTVDGTKYNLAADALAQLSPTAGTATKGITYSFTNEYDLYLSNGYVIGTDGIAGSAAADLEDVVYVTAVSNAVTTSEYTGAYYVRCVTLDGKVENVHNYGWDDTTSGKVRKESKTVYAAATSAPADIAAGFYTRDYDSDTDTYKFTKVNVGTSAGTKVESDKDPFLGSTTLNNSGSLSMKTSTSSIKVTALKGYTPGTKAYITENTTLLFVSGTGTGTKATVAKGAVRQTIADGAPVLVSVDKDGNAIVEVMVIAAKQTSSDGTVVFVNGAKTEGIVHVGSNNRTQYGFYNIETGEKTVVPVSAAPKTGFATYTVDEDGVYTFEDPEFKANAKDDDGTYLITRDATLFGGTKLSNNVVGNVISDLDATSAFIKTIVTDGEIDTLEEIVDAETAGFTAYAYAKDGKLTAIFVTNEGDADLDVESNAVRFYSTIADAVRNAVASDGSVDLGTIKTATGTTGATIKVDKNYTSGAFSDDSVSVTYTWDASGATASYTSDTDSAAIDLVRVVVADSSATATYYTAFAVTQ
jgi:hypothetical protein